MLLICGLRFMVLLTVVSSNTAESFTSIWLFLTLMGMYYLEFWRVVIMSCVFLALGLMNQSSHQSSGSSTCFYR